MKDGNKINPVAVAVIRWGGVPGIFYIFHSLNVNILTRKQHPTWHHQLVHLQIDRPVFNLSNTLQAWYHPWSHTTLSFVTASHTIVLCYYFHTSFLLWTKLCIFHFLSCPLVSCESHPPLTLPLSKSCVQPNSLQSIAWECVNIQLTGTNFSQLWIANLQWSVLKAYMYKHT